MTPASTNNSHVSDAPFVAFRPVRDDLDRQHLFGLDFVNAPDLEPIVDAIARHHDRPVPDARAFTTCSGSLGAVVTPNVDILVSLDRRSPTVVRDVYSRAQYVLPDGMPVVAASKVLGRPLQARLTGSGLFNALWPRLVGDRRRVVLLCSNEGIAESLRAEHSDAEFVIPPYFQPGDSINRAVIAKELLAAIERVEAEYVLLGVGHPKDALIVAELHGLCEEADRSPPLCLCLGGSFSMYVGQQRRAPELMQRIGMEWFYRFIQEPRRLFRRYFVDDLAFLGLVRRERSKIDERAAS